MVLKYLEKYSDEIDRKWDEYVIGRLETLIDEYSDLTQDLESVDPGSGVVGALDQALGDYQDVWKVLAGEDGIDFSTVKGSSPEDSGGDEKALLRPQDEE